MTTIPVQKPTNGPVQAGAENIAGRRRRDQQPRIVFAGRDQPSEYKFRLCREQSCGREGDTEQAKVRPKLHDQRLGVWPRHIQPAKSPQTGLWLAEMNEPSVLMSTYSILLARLRSALFWNVTTHCWPPLRVRISLLSGFTLDQLAGSFA